MTNTNQAFVLRQFPTKFEDIKKGDLFRMTYHAENGEKQVSDWHVAVSDAVPEDGGVKLAADTVHFIIGRPEYVSLASRDGVFTKSPMQQPVNVPPQKPASPTIGSGAGTIGGRQGAETRQRRSDA